MNIRELKNRTLHDARPLLSHLRPLVACSRLAGIECRIIYQPRVDSKRGRRGHPNIPTLIGRWLKPLLVLLNGANRQKGEHLGEHQLLTRLALARLTKPHASAPCQAGPTSLCTLEKGCTRGPINSTVYCRESACPTPGPTPPPPTNKKKMALVFVCLVCLSVCLTKVPSSAKACRWRGSPNLG